MLGDSLSAGHGLGQGQSWVALLERRLAARGLPHRVVNASVSGLTTAEGRARLPDLLARHRPAVLVLALGGNDGLRGLPLRAMEANLRAMVEQARAAGARVLLAGVRLPPNYGPFYTRAFERVFRKVADETGAVLLPSLLAGVEEDRSLFQADGLHPTAAAQPRILDNVWPLLQPLLEATARPTA